VWRENQLREWTRQPAQLARPLLFEMDELRQWLVWAPADPAYDRESWLIGGGRDPAGWLGADAGGNVSELRLFKPIRKKTRLAPVGAIAASLATAAKNSMELRVEVGLSRCPMGIHCDAGCDNSTRRRPKSPRDWGRPQPASARIPGGSRMILRPRRRQGRSKKTDRWTHSQDRRHQCTFLIGTSK
jgi:hypothetical protein